MKTGHSTMGAFFLLFVVSASLLLMTDAQCTTTQNGKTYNLSPLTKIGSGAMDWIAKAPNGDKLYINFCGKIIATLCPAIPSAVCGNFSGVQGSAGALADQSWAALQSGEGVALTYGSGSICPTASSAKRQTTINVVCNQNESPGSFGSVQENANCEYIVVFNSKYGCPVTTPPPPPGPPGPPPPPPPPSCSGSGSGSGSGCVEPGGKNGIYFIVAVIVASVVYFGGGSLIRKFALHKEGSDIIPQVDFWKDLPFLVKDGIVYSCTRIWGKIRGGEHEPLLR